jgi:hypothetical protein
VPVTPWQVELLPGQSLLVRHPLHVPPVHRSAPPLPRPVHVAALLQQPVFDVQADGLHVPLANPVHAPDAHVDVHVATLHVPGVELHVEPAPIELHSLPR